MPATASTHVTVACKLPNGLICDIVDMAQMKARKAELDAGKPVFIGRKGSFRLRGTAAARRLDSNGLINLEAKNVEHAFGLTQVPTELWEAWLDQNKEYPAVKNGLIYAHASGELESAVDYAKDHLKLKTGFDPIDPDKPAKGIEAAKDVMANREEEAEF